MGIEYYICDEKNKRAFELNKGFAKFFENRLPGASVPVPDIADWLLAWWNEPTDGREFWDNVAIQIWAFCQTAQWHITIKNDCDDCDELDEYPCVYTRFVDKSECQPDPLAEEHAKWVQEAEKQLKESLARVSLKRDMFEELRKAIELVDQHVGCGDSSCMFVRSKGMVTNGGCRCCGIDSRPFVPSALANLYKKAKNLVISE